MVIRQHNNSSDYESIKRDINMLVDNANAREHSELEIIVNYENRVTVRRYDTYTSERDEVNLLTSDVDTVIKFIKMVAEARGYHKDIPVDNRR